jgi:hypothetical protein
MGVSHLMFPYGLAWTVSAYGKPLSLWQHIGYEHTVDDF